MVAVLVLLCTACSGAASVTSAPSQMATPPATAAPPPATAAASEPAGVPTGDAPAPSPTEPLDDTALPGTSVRLHNPTAALAVVGAAERGIPVVTAPGDAAPEAVTAWAGSTRITATGRARQLPGGIWVEVTTAPQQAVGWARSANLVRASVMEDVTAAVRSRFDGDLPEAADIDLLGARVADSEAAFYDGATVSRARPGVVEGVGDVSYDIALPDDEAVSAIRLRVIGSPAGARDDRVRLVAVERSLLCRRDAVKPGVGCDLRCLLAPAQPEWKVREGDPPARPAA